jgi:hypothetical protein
LFVRDFGARKANQDGKGFEAGLFHEESVDFQMHWVIVDDQNLGMTRVHVEPPGK